MEAHMVEDIVSRLTAEMNHQANIAFPQPPYESPAPAPGPPATSAHATTDPILQQVLAQNQDDENAGFQWQCQQQFQ